MYSAFPLASRQGDQAPLTMAVSAVVDEILNSWGDWWNNYRANLIDPMSIDPALYDFVATLPSSPWLAIGWNPGWSDAAKQQLLLWTTEIFENRYTPEALSRLFLCFGSEAKVEYLAGWILGGVGVGTNLGPSCIIGGGLTAYRVKIPSYYKVGTPERAIVDWCLKNFGLPIDVQILAS